jgi:plasmid maintenance system antidote protein VapI
LGAWEEFSPIAVKGLGHSGVEVARYLGVTGSCVTRIVAERHLTEDIRLKYQNL